MDLAPDATLIDADARPALFAGEPSRDPISEILGEAAARGATHVHLDPDGDAMRVRARIGGRLTELPRLPSAIDLRFEGRGASVATHGERIVLHLAPRELRYPALEALGMSVALARGLGGLTSGLVLVAGPAGSGRGTTLAALLGADDGARNLLRAANADELRAVLRQDPDAILIDSIADRETVALALQAAEAGHLVLGRIDASDAVAAILRMRALRADPFQLASTLQGGARAASREAAVRRVPPTGTGAGLDLGLARFRRRDRGLRARGLRRVRRRFHWPDRGVRGDPDRRRASPAGQ